MSDVLSIYETLPIESNVSDGSVPEETNVTDLPVSNCLSRFANSRIGLPILCNTPYERFRFEVFFIIRNEIETTPHILSNWLLREGVLARLQTFDYEFRLSRDRKRNYHCLDVGPGEEWLDTLIFIAIDVRGFLKLQCRLRSIAHILRGLARSRVDSDQAG